MRRAPGQTIFLDVLRALPVRALVVLSLTSALTLIVLAAASPPVHGAETATRTLVDRGVSVRTPPMPTGLSMRSGIVVDSGDGEVLWAMRPREVRLIASTTKIMTAMIAISRSRPDQMLTATAYHPDAAESVIGLKPGERLTASDLIKALLMESANDAADTLAARLASSRGAFVSAMNRRARALGLRDTRYGNPVGLDTPRTVSSARDLAKLTTAAMREPRFRSVVGRRRATLRSGSRRRHIVNRNKLLQDHSWVDGVKTGHTLRAGYLLVGSAFKHDARVISVVMGEPTERGRWGDSLKLLRFGRAFFKTVRPLAANGDLAKLPVALQDVDATIYTKRGVTFALRDGERYKVALVAPKELDGPLAAGSRVGTVTVTRNGRIYQETAALLRSAVPAPPIEAVLLHQLQRLLPALLILAIVFMIGLLLLRRRDRRGPQGIGRAAARPQAP